jgi:hypothetical protein
VAPGDNTAAPINVGSVTQAKSGNLMANIMAAATSTWSPEYCDEMGNNCWEPGSSVMAAAASGIGTNQTWQMVPRSQGVWYRNNTDQPIMVFHKNIWDGSIIDVGVSTTSFVTMNYQDFDSDLDNGSTLIVPVGNYYRFGTYTEVNQGHYLVRELREPSNIAYTYAWQIGAWGACTPRFMDNCSTTGTQARSVSCARSDGVNNLDDASCPAPKPIASRSCTRQPSGSDC